MRVRHHDIDTVRGAALISMIVYHGCWDLVYLCGAPWAWYRSFGAYLWQQSICWTFILLSGICVSLGKNKVKRGLVVFGAGILISLVTEFFMPQNRIRFGVLTLLGSCMLIAALAERINVTIWGIIINLLLFILTRRINYGVLGFADVTVARLPRFLYNLGDFGNYLGFTEQTFFSAPQDFFQLFAPEQLQELH